MDAAAPALGHPPVPSFWLRREPVPAVVRRLASRDRPLLEAHLRALPPARRVERFGRAVTDEGNARHCAALDLARGMVLGVVDERLRGAAELAPDAMPGRLEVALTLDEEPGWEARGLVLLSAAAERGRTLGFAVLVAHVGDEETRVPALLRDLGGRTLPAFGEAVLPLAGAPWPLPL
jgi:hypothetical protein